MERLYAQDTVTVLGDSDHLYRAFLNVFNNALQAMEEQGGRMVVSTRTVGSAAAAGWWPRWSDTAQGLIPKYGPAFGSIFHHQGKGHRPGFVHCKQYHHQPQRQDGIGQHLTGAGPRVEMLLPQAGGGLTWKGG